MKRPKQLPAVDRNTKNSAAAPAGSKVSPSAWTDYIGPIANALGGIF